jgi:hypothetical protein
LNTYGYASYVFAAILGYLERSRKRPHLRGKSLTVSGGQYFTCIGHSFGGRFLGEALALSASPPDPRTLGWPWRSKYPFGVDSVVVFQMAAPREMFDRRFLPLITGDAPVHGPIVLTHSARDRANAVWHRIVEFGKPGIGARGALSRFGASWLVLKRAEEAYQSRDFESKLVNVDAGWCYDGGDLVQGVHSSFWHVESIHLLLSVMSLSR